MPTPSFKETIIEDLGNALTLIKFVRDGTLPIDTLDDVERRIRLALKKAAAVKLYVDDDRQLPVRYLADGYRLVRSAEIALEIVKYVGLANVTHISFDHDLGTGVMTGYDLVKYIEERVIVFGDPMPEMEVHSQNPAGAANIRAAIAAMSRHVAGIAASSN